MAGREPPCPDSSPRSAPRHLLTLTTLAFRAWQVGDGALAPWSRADLTRIPRTKMPAACAGVSASKRSRRVKHQAGQRKQRDPAGKKNSGGPEFGMSGRFASALARQRCGWAGPGRKSAGATQSPSR
jgi:hypothetical protein